MHPTPPRDLSSADEGPRSQDVRRHKAALERRLGRPVATAVAEADLWHRTGHMPRPVVIDEDHYLELQRRAVVDGKTGLLNYTAFATRLRDELARAERHHYPMSLIMIDIDGLKELNDKRGHLAGDEAIRALADVMRHTSRRGDFCARFGGDEMAVVAPHADEGQALRLAVRILEEARRVLRPMGSGVSLGVASWPRSAHTATELVDAADRALYRAKRAGGNRIAATTHRLRSA